MVQEFWKFRFEEFYVDCLEYFEVSAKDATNVEVAFNELAKHAADSNVENKPLSDIPSDLGMPPPDTETPSGCSC
jgi:hypothetical protein